MANVGAGAGTDVRRPGPLRVHHHADQPREEERGLREHVLELQQERQQRQSDVKCFVGILSRNE